MGFQKEIVQNLAQQDKVRQVKSVGKRKKTVAKKKSKIIRKTKTTKTGKKKPKKKVKKSRWVRI